MSEDIVTRLSKMLSWENAEQAIIEIKLLRKMVRDWEQTAKILALDLGHPEYAVEIYEDVQDGLYDKVRQRMLPETGGLNEIDILKAEVAHWREFSQNLAMLGSISELNDYLKDE